MDLRPARQSWRDLKSIFARRRLINRQEGTRTDEGHGAGEDIPQLWQLVQPRPSQKFSKTGCSSILLDEMPAAVERRMHGSDFIDEEGFTVLSVTLLPERNAPTEIDQHAQGHNRKNGGQYYQQGQRDAEVEDALDFEVASHSAYGRFDRRR